MFKVALLRLEEPIKSCIFMLLFLTVTRSAPSLRRFPDVACATFECSSGWRWPSLVRSRKIIERFLLLWKINSFTVPLHLGIANLPVNPPFCLASLEWKVLPTLLLFSCVTLNNHGLLNWEFIPGVTLCRWWYWCRWTTLIELAVRRVSKIVIGFLTSRQPSSKLN